MAYQSFIPKIEWLKNSFTGTTAIGSDTITGISNTDNVQVGMFFEGAGIPSGSTVVSKTASTVTITNNATAAGSVTLSFGFRIEFDLPPRKDPLAESPKFNGTVKVAKNGDLQSIKDFIERNNNLQFSHVSQTIKDQFDNFLETHAFDSKKFSYFTDKNEPSSEIIVTKSVRYTDPRFQIMTRKGAGLNFLWKFRLQLRRVI